MADKKKLQQEVPETLQEFAEWFKKSNSVINKNNVQYFVDMYWHNKLINNGQDSNLCTN